jgi:ABC-type branched-subunit amino acid transport system ATPase component
LEKNIIITTKIENNLKYPQKKKTKKKKTIRSIYDLVPKMNEQI